MLARKALAGTAAAPKVYVEDVFSTYLYSGTGASQTITNNIDLSGEGGLVWGKMRNDSGNHFLQDTERGTTKSLTTNNTDGDITVSQYITAFNNNGFTLGTNLTVNGSTYTYASWTFRKAEKFFDVVTYTGNGSNRTISHNLGSVPGCIIIKRTDSAADWQVYHRSLANTEYLVLNTNAAKATGTTRWNSTTPTSTEFSLGTDTTVNANSGTYVAYLFAHDAGGFGDAGSDNVISCGSFNSTSAVSLGWEPQWILFKKSNDIGDWTLVDSMRGLPGVFAVSLRLRPNTSNAEDNDGILYISPTGFIPEGHSGGTYIYIAIRRGPMKTPTTGTSVFGDTYASVEPVSTNLTTESGVLADLVIHGLRISGTTFGRHWMSRLTGNGRYLVSSSTNAEVFQSSFWTFDNNNYAYIPPNGYANNNGTGTPYVAYSFKRAPGFFDEVCYIGTGSNRTVSHNLGVAPELMIVKGRDDAFGNWFVYPNDPTDYLILNNTGQQIDSNTPWNDTAPTSNAFTVGTSGETNGNGYKYVAYLFASLSGVSKIGTYTGNGSSVTVTTNFQPRFILVKRTDSTGNWIVGDSARGLVSADEPALFLNSTAAETTGQDWVDVSSTSFTVNETALNANVNTATYLYLAVA